MNQTTKLLPEWSPQEAVLLSWPDLETDWAHWLLEVQSTYIELINAINKFSCSVLLLVRPTEIKTVKALLSDTSKVLLIPAEYNDTWIRDYGFLTCEINSEMHPFSFQFNGWGNKFSAHKDNKINNSVLACLCRNPMTEYDLVLEGGAVEIDSDGLLLSTKLCLTNPQRNGNLQLTGYQKHFSKTLGATKSVILKNGHLEGDDTDGHIDTLVRFTPENNLVIQTAFNRPLDSHFAGLQALVEECQQLLPKRKIFKLPLPYIKNNEDERLPASYANFLISNQCIFAPIYGQPEDDKALNVLASAYSGFKIIPINCHSLVQQFGSLHCISMQVPTYTLKPEIIKQANSRVSVYDD